MRLGIPEHFAGIYCMVIACNVKLLSFEYSIITEALAALWLVGITAYWCGHTGYVLCFMHVFCSWDAMAADAFEELI